MNKTLGAEGTVVIAATKIPRTNFPDQIATVFSVVSGNRTLSRVMCKAARLRTHVQSHDGIGTQGTKTHGGHIEQADVVGLFAIRTTYMNSEVMRRND